MEFAVQALLIYSVVKLYPYNLNSLTGLLSGLYRILIFVLVCSVLLKLKKISFKNFQTFLLYII